MYNLEANILNRQASMDMMVNTMSGQGTKSDKDVYNRFVDEPPISEQEIVALYMNDWLAKKVVDAIPHDMIRAWRKVSGLAKAELEAFTAAEDEFEIKLKIEEAKKFARRDGGAGIIIGTKGTGGVTSALHLEDLKKGNLRYLHVVDKHTLRIKELETNPLSPNFRKPKYYRIKNVDIHPSRVIAFRGEQVPHSISADYDHWGASIYQKMRSVLARVNVAYGAGSAMLHESSIDIISIRGLFNMIGDCSGENAVLRRLSMSNLMKSSYNAVIKDTEEDFTKITQNFAGIPDMIREMVIAACGAAETPVTRLLGISPSGLNATGQSDLINYYDTVASRQKIGMAPKLDKLDRLLQMHVFGRTINTFTNEFNPLWEPNSLEASSILEKTTNAHEKASVIVPYEVILKTIQKEGHYKMSDDEIDAQVAKGFNLQKEESDAAQQNS